MKTIGLVLVLAAAACGGVNEGAKASNGDGTNTGAGTSAGSGSQAPTSATVRLSGGGAAGAIRVRVEMVDLSIDGHALPSADGGGEVDIGTDATAWPLSTFALPSDAQKVEVTLTFAPEGSLERDGKSLPLDLHGPPISFVADAAEIRARSKVVLALDASRSVVDSNGQAFLLPVYSVHY